MNEYEVMQQKLLACEYEIGREIIGQKEIVRSVLLAILSGGNVLLEGMPGLGKTRLVNTISHVLDLSFKRIQFTPDLMPGDITDKIALDGPEVCLCLKATFDDMKDRLDFYYLKGNKFVKFGASHKMEFRLSHFTGNRFGLCCYSTRTPGGKAVFKNFEYNH